MSWTVEGHQLRLLSGLHDGQTGDVYRDGQVQATADVGGFTLVTWRQGWHPISEVDAFVVVCDCAVPGKSWTRRMVLARWERVPSEALEDLQAGRVYVAADQDAPALAGRADVKECLHQLWAEHRAPGEAVAAIEEAWVQSRRAAKALDEAVIAGRRVGLSWVDVGRAVGVTRQSARERWSRLQDPAR